jgi:AbrB family looped-hinge helix DNA binding protein
MKYGYARTSTDDQTTALQLTALKRARCSHIYEDKGLSGATSKSPALASCFRTLRPGDTLTVWKLERLGRSLRDLITMLDELRSRGVKFHSLTEGRRILDHAHRAVCAAPACRRCEEIDRHERKKPCGCAGQRFRLILVGEMATVTISSKGQIAIPKALRERLNLRAGTEISIDVQGDALIVKRLARNFPDWRTMQGMVRDGGSLTQALEAEHGAELAGDDARLQGS